MRDGWDLALHALVMTLICVMQAIQSSMIEGQYCIYCANYGCYGEDVRKNLFQIRKNTWSIFFLLCANTIYDVLKFIFSLTT